MPKATKFPRSRYGGTSEKFMLRKPSAVVRLARNTGCRLSLRDSTMASCRESPARKRCCKATRRCTQLATTIISTMVGAGAMGGEKGKPAHTPRPIDASIEKTMTSPVPATPAQPRTRTPRTTAMSTRLAGRKIIWLLMDASTKVWLTITVPTVRRSMPGNRSSACTATSRANSATSATASNWSSTGSLIVTLTTLTSPLRARMLPSIRGSDNAISRIRDRARASDSTCGSMRSRTYRSSPSAVVCWKLASESTRLVKGVCQAASVSHTVASSASSEVASPSSGTIRNAMFSFFP